MKRPPPQVSRLLLLAAGIVAIYFIARIFLVPESFGEYGWYRGAALQERAELPVSYAGAEACLECHDEQEEVLQKSGHRSLSCEGCHGAVYEHSLHPTSKAALPARIQDQRFCLRCHLRTGSRPTEFPQIVEPGHSDGESCLSCHLPHNPEESPE